eukprot:1707126-Alexandrium_andersonii.AAC.1
MAWIGLAERAAAPGSGSRGAWVAGMRKSSCSEQGGLQGPPSSDWGVTGSVPPVWVDLSSA